MLFEELGFRYFGPIDGHDMTSLLRTFEVVKGLKGPRLVHVLTEKGRGFPLDEPDREKFHARNPYDPVTGVLKPAKTGLPQWTKVFGDALTELAAEYPDLVAVTAAMPSGTGTNIFEQRWPERFFDVGIAQGHATTFAAGLAADVNYLMIDQDVFEDGLYVPLTLNLNWNWISWQCSLIELVNYSIQTAKQYICLHSEINERIIPE